MGSLELTSPQVGSQSEDKYMPQKRHLCSYYKYLSEEDLCKVETGHDVILAKPVNCLDQTPVKYSGSGFCLVHSNLSISLYVTVRQSLKKMFLFTVSLKAIVF